MHTRQRKVAVSVLPNCSVGGSICSVSTPLSWSSVFIRDNSLPSLCSSAERQLSALFSVAWASTATTLMRKVCSSNFMSDFALLLFYQRYSQSDEQCTMEPTHGVISLVKSTVIQIKHFDGTRVPVCPWDRRGWFCQTIVWVYYNVLPLPLPLPALYLGTLVKLEGDISQAHGKPQSTVRRVRVQPLVASPPRAPAAPRLSTIGAQ